MFNFVLNKTQLYSTGLEGLFMNSGPNAVTPTKEQADAIRRIREAVNNASLRDGCEQDRPIMLTTLVILVLYAVETEADLQDILEAVHLIAIGRIRDLTALRMHRLVCTLYWSNCHLFTSDDYAVLAMEAIRAIDSPHLPKPEFLQELPLTAQI